MTDEAEKKWWRVASVGLPSDGKRLHSCVEGRFVTVFRNRGNLSVIDAICHHAGGPLTLGPIEDIEELGATVVSCPWHKFLVSISDGKKGAFLRPILPYIRNYLIFIL